jgi:hypothetical protein
VPVALFPRASRAVESSRVLVFHRSWPSGGHNGLVPCKTGQAWLLPRDCGRIGPGHTNLHGLRCWSQGFYLLCFLKEYKNVSDLTEIIGGQTGRIRKELGLIQKLSEGTGAKIPSLGVPTLDSPERSVCRASQRLCQCME